VLVSGFKPGKQSGICIRKNVQLIWPSKTVVSLFVNDNYRRFHKHTCMKMSSRSLLCNKSWSVISSGFLIFVISGSLSNLILPFSILGLTSFSSSSNISCFTATSSTIHKFHLT
jgi:hypothetical protein